MNNYDKFLSGYDCFIVKQYEAGESGNVELDGQYFIKRALIGKRFKDYITTTKHEQIPLECCFSLSQGAEALIMMQHLNEESGN